MTDWTKPTSDDVTFELEAPPVTCGEQNMGDNYNVVFVIDISGSMGQSTYVSILFFCDNFVTVAYSKIFV